MKNKALALLLILFPIAFFSCASSKTEPGETLEETLEQPGQKVAVADAVESGLTEPEAFEEPLVRDLELKPEEQLTPQDTLQKADAEEVLPGKNEEPVEITEELEQLQESPSFQQPLSGTEETSDGSFDGITYIERTDGTDEADSPENQAEENAPVTSTEEDGFWNAHNSSPDLLNQSDGASDSDTEQNAGGNYNGTEDKNDSERQDTEGLTESSYSGGITGTLRTAPDAELPADTEEDEPAKEIIIPSRSVTLNKGESLVVVYPGSGWVYMGSLSEYNNLTSRGRRLGATDTTYTLLAREAGTQIHHFYKADNITGAYVDDYLEVTVLDKKGSAKTTVLAPDYASAVPKRPETPARAESKSNPEDNYIIQYTKDTAAAENQEQAYTSASENSRQEEAPETQEDELWVIDEESPNGQEIDTEAILEEAKNLYNQKEYAQAEALLKDFFEYATDGRDEALYFRGQLLEADSPVKDIKGAIEAYETLTKNYPASKYWDRANKRITYLRRFYIEVR